MTQPTLAGTEIPAVSTQDAGDHQARRRRPHGWRPLEHRHPECALQPRPQRLAGELRQARSRPLHPEQGPLRRGPVRGAGRPRFLSFIRARDAVQVPIAFRRPSHAQGSGHRAQHRSAGAWTFCVRWTGVWAPDCVAPSYKVFTLLGDGELAEGSNWEAAMLAAHYGLDNLVAIVDCNGLQITGATREVCSNEPLDAKFAAFGWHVKTVDGHDLQALETALAETRAAAGRCPPRSSRARSKAAASASWRDVVRWHHGVPTDDEYRAGARRARRGARRAP